MAVDIWMPNNFSPVVSMEALGIPWFPPLMETQSVLLKSPSVFWTVETNKIKQKQKIKVPHWCLMLVSHTFLLANQNETFQLYTKCPMGKHKVLWENTRLSILFLKSEFQFHPIHDLSHPSSGWLLWVRPFTHPLTTNSHSSWLLPHGHQKH